MKRIILLVSFLTIFTACGPAKRLERILRRHPELATVDTIQFQDTTQTPGRPFEFAEFDIYDPGNSGLKPPPFNDAYTPGSIYPAIGDRSVILEDSNVKIRITPVRNAQGIIINRLKVTGEVKPQTFIDKHTFTVEKTKVYKKTVTDLVIDTAKWVLGAFCLLMLFLIFRKLIP